MKEVSKLKKCDDYEFITQLLIILITMGGSAIACILSLWYIASKFWTAINF